MVFVLRPNGVNPIVSKVIRILLYTIIHVYTNIFFNNIRLFTRELITMQP